VQITTKARRHGAQRQNLIGFPLVYGHHLMI
jgi:hypothetical protein